MDGLNTGQVLASAKGNQASLRVIKEKASQHAENLRPVVEALRSDGVMSLG